MLKIIKNMYTLKLILAISRIVINILQKVQLADNNNVMSISIFKLLKKDIFVKMSSKQFKQAK